MFRPLFQRWAMLNINHPMSQHIFAASRSLDRVLLVAIKMTVATRQERMRLRNVCVPVFIELRQLGQEHFANCTTIPVTIDVLERSLAELTELPGVPKDGPSAELNCPACGSTLMRVEHPKGLCCSPCLQIINPPLWALSSWDGGFGCDAI